MHGGSWTPLGKQGLSHFITLLPSCPGAFTGLWGWDKSEGTQAASSGRAPTNWHQGSKCTLPALKDAKILFVLSPPCMNDSCPSGKNVFSTVSNSSFRCYSCLPPFEFKVSTTLGKNPTKIPRNCTNENTWRMKSHTEKEWITERLVL